MAGRQHGRHAASDGVRAAGGLLPGVVHDPARPLRGVGIAGTAGIWLSATLPVASCRSPSHISLALAASALTAAAEPYQPQSAGLTAASRLCAQAARALRKSAAGASHRGLIDRVTGFRMQTLAQLVHWGLLMAVAGLLLVVLLESTRGDAPVASFSDYLQVGPLETYLLVSGSAAVRGCPPSRAALVG
jgi:hypothetical protein